MTVETMSVRDFVASTMMVAIGSLVLGTSVSGLALFPLSQDTSFITFGMSSLFLGILSMLTVSTVYVFSTIILTLLAYTEDEISSS